MLSHITSQKKLHLPSSQFNGCSSERHPSINLLSVCHVNFSEHALGQFIHFYLLPP